MTKIDFYQGKEDRLRLTCRLVHRIRADGLRVLIHCPDADQARALDRLLWILPGDSFLPHGLVGAVDAELTPVLISADGQPEQETQVLINLAREVPAFFARFARLCEPLDPDPEVLAAGRQRWKQYQALGHPLDYHRLDAEKPGARSE